MSVILGFQFTQPKRAATFFINLHPSGYKFQFTQPKRAATRRYFYFARGSVGFNSRSPSGLRLAVANYRALWVCFNSRSPSGLRQAPFNVAGIDLMFQFTQPKRAATTDGAGTGAWEWVSIHAAQVGCDAGDEVALSDISVSIHAAQAGCDISIHKPWCVALGFNSRSPSGLRLSHRTRNESQPMFQFTQPKRAATSTYFTGLLEQLGFNSRSPSGLRRATS